MGSDSGRKRKVRGRKIRSDRSVKERRKAEKQRRRAAKENGTSGSANGTTDASTDVLRSPQSAAPDPFVSTDAVEDLTTRIGRWLEADQPVHVVGPTGCGKTALALSAAAERGRPVVWIDGDQAVDTGTLVGEHAGGESYVEDDQYVSGVHKRTEVVRERWVDNPLSVAAREGATLVYNEFSRSDPLAHNVLLSVFEEGVLERPEKRGDDRKIDVHPEFRAILTSNTAEYAGVHEPQDALLDRMVGVHVDYYDAETEREIVAAHVELPDDQVERVVDATRALREELDVVVGTRVAITAAKGLAVFGTGGDDAIDDEVLVTVFTDVLAPKFAGREDGADVASLEGRVADAI
ncbi:gas vesicle protein GvpN [Natronosalvus halobius]|uniref:gas vesicle protein GvpN n=1 Tax=Natronosalvus halobius TaxID=2953746 RepID=UPI00209D13F0|nr:gas vesicle protein GvpN [Natronosalvus halobius]USZ73202.1 gas vesicle protein GvpN [Natronosalvus halobius]